VPVDSTHQERLRRCLEFQEFVADATSRIASAEPDRLDAVVQDILCSVGAAGEVGPGMQAAIALPGLADGLPSGVGDLASTAEPSELPEEVVPLLRILTDVISGATARRSSDQAALQAEQRFNTVFDGMGSAVMLVDDTGAVLMANISALSCLGLADADSLVGRPLAEAVPGCEVMLRDATPAMQQVFNLTLEDGQRRDIGFTSSPLSEDRRRIIVFRDVTRLLDLEQRRQRAEQLAQVGEVAARMSHEIRNPLASILMGLETLERQVFLRSDDNMILQQIIHEVSRLSTVITGLLDSAKLQAIAPRPMRLEPLLRDCLDWHAPSASAKRIELVLSEGPFDSQATVDGLAMTRILANLLRNALEACEEGGSRVRFGWRTPDDDERRARFPGFDHPVVSVFVEDDGPGIDPAVLEQMFEPFVTTKTDGTGLGLAVVWDLVHEMGGHIEVECGFLPRSRGSKVEIFFPAGEREPCWEMRKTMGPESSSCKGPDTCPVGCSVCEANAGYVCWTVMGKASKLETGEWSEDCLQCPAYLRGDLGPYATHRTHPPT
jgi:signal transduction histidine kinase